jgi:hypothetical protein
MLTGATVREETAMSWKKAERAVALSCPAQADDVALGGGTTGVTDQVSNARTQALG